MFRRAVTTASVAMLAISTTGMAGGPVQYVDQFREVRTLLYLPGERDQIMEITSGALGFFDESLEDSASNGVDFASAAVSQTSWLLADGITGSGSLFGSGSLDALGTSRSDLQATFTLSESSEFTFGGMLDDLLVDRSAGFSLNITLQRTSGESIFSVTQDDIDYTFPGGDIELPAFSGELDPDEYFFQFRIAMSGFKDTFNGTGYAYALTIPAPGVLAFLGAGAVGWRGRSRRRCPVW